MMAFPGRGLHCGLLSLPPCTWPLLTQLCTQQSAKWFYVPVPRVHSVSPALCLGLHNFPFMLKTHVISLDAFSFLEVTPWPVSFPQLRFCPLVPWHLLEVIASSSFSLTLCNYGLFLDFFYHLWSLTVLCIFGKWMKAAGEALWNCKCLKHEPSILCRWKLAQGYRLFH